MRHNQGNRRTRARLLHSVLKGITMPPRLLLLTTPPNAVFNILQASPEIVLLCHDLRKYSRMEIMRLLDKESPADADALLTYRCPWILPESCLSSFPLGAYNLHPSLLPRYAGANPWPEILSSQEDFSGVTLHRLTVPADSGEIILQEKFELPPSRDLKKARQAADRTAAGLAVQLVRMLAGQ